MKDQLSDIKEAMQKSENQGMKTFDSALYDLAKAGRISQDEALKNADSANNLRLRFKLSSPSDEEDQSDLLLRGQLPSQVAAAKATAEKADSKNTENSNDSENTETDQGMDVHAAMAAQIANHKAANETSMEEEANSNGTGGLEAAAQAFELSLEMEPEPEAPDPESDEESDTVQFGMGKIG